MSKIYHHVVFNPMAEGLSILSKIDANYELVAIIPHHQYESVAVFIEHTDAEPIPVEEES